MRREQIARLAGLFDGATNVVVPPGDLLAQAGGRHFARQGGQGVMQACLRILPTFRYPDVLDDPVAQRDQSPRGIAGSGRVTHPRRFNPEHKRSGDRGARLVLRFVRGVGPGTRQQIAGVGIILIRTTDPGVGAPGASVGAGPTQAAGSATSANKHTRIGNFDMDRFAAKVSFGKSAVPGW